MTDNETNHKSISNHRQNLCNTSASHWTTENSETRIGKWTISRVGSKININYLTTTALACINRATVHGIRIKGLIYFDSRGEGLEFQL
jgi:hypothetical protein